MSLQSLSLKLPYFSIFFKFTSTSLFTGSTFYYFLLKFEQFHDYFIQYSLKSGNTKDHFRQVKIPPLIERSAINCKVTDESKGWPRLQAEFLFSYYLKSLNIFIVSKS
jgi:hypothetical protein